MISEVLRTKREGITALPRQDKPVPSVSIPQNIAVKCQRCKEILYERDWCRNLKVCRYCDYHFKLTAHERIELLVDQSSFVEVDADIVSADPLHFVSQSQVYAEKLEQERRKVHLNEAVVTGYATVEGKPLSLAVMDFRFMGGSMGAAAGEKITRAIELGIERRIPVLISSASGGARMQEGIFSLMQMAKTSAALARLGEAGIPYYSLLTDPTAGGVTASFAMLGDVIFAEPGSLVCFAGPRVIEQFMHVSLPKDTVTAEFIFRHGLIDAVVHRRELRSFLIRLMHLYYPVATLIPVNKQ
ncbi:MAG TPA: acetyl-CoA carboxylase, carboxyltransferase subunit beta [Ktedonosporobacter sp.]|jgi:acetyl-CoA carboxylase carboxyl transferase subunit beta|nr:acetyl-CoA carboxylase, carboxyltransferase subunit beta [Ktedonosporobacter sp.]